MAMGTWKTRLLSKKSRGSQTPGSKKGLVPPAWARHCAKAAKSYKNNPMYSKWCAMCNGDKVKWSSGN